MNVKRMFLFLLMVLMVIGGVFAESVAQDGVIVSTTWNHSETTVKVENTNDYLVNVVISYKQIRTGVNSSKTVAVKADDWESFKVNGTSISINSVRVTTQQSRPPSSTSTTLSGTYQYNRDYYITFGGNNTFTLVWNGAPSSGTFTVSGNSVTLRGGAGRGFRIISPTELEDGDGDIWEK
jgi:hypothetical protein